MARVDSKQQRQKLSRWLQHFKLHSQRIPYGDDDSLLALQEKASMKKAEEVTVLRLK